MLKWQFSNTIRFAMGSFFCSYLELMVLLKYYADQGGEASLKALEAVKIRFGGVSSPVMAKSPTVDRPTRPRAAVLPDFFQLASA